MALWCCASCGRGALRYTALLAGTLLVLGALTAVLLDRGLRDNVDASLQSMAQLIGDNVRRPSPFGPGIDELLESMLGPGVAERFFSLLDPFGRPDPRGPRSRVPLPLSPEALHNVESGRATYETLVLGAGARAPIRLLTAPIVESGRVVRVVQVAMSLEAVEAARRRFFFIILALAPLALSASAAGGWLLARRALAPVDRMVETARRIEAEDLSRRLETPDADDEIGRLAAVLNDMLARLERSFVAVRQFSADAAHELRTPLTILKGEMEVALRSPTSPEEYRRVLSSGLEEVDRLSALVEDMLFLARTESGNMRLDAARVNLAEVLEDVTPGLRALAESAGVQLTATAPLGVWTSGSAPLLLRVVFNLGENAIKYTPAGGTVELSVYKHRGAAVIDVRDTGPGISAEDRERIFDRFYRGDPARVRGGTGLGLALVRSIVILHGGRIDVESSPGMGSGFRVRLPLASAAER